MKKNFAPIILILTISEMEKIAKRDLSSFAGPEDYTFNGGQDSNPELLMNAYTGQDDVFIDGANFGGPRGGIDIAFKEALAAGRVFPLYITNVLATTETINLFYPPLPAAIGTAGPSTNGYIRTQTAAAYNSVGGNAAFKSAPDVAGRYIEELIAFIHRNPARLLGFRIKSSDDSQIDQALSIVKKSPFRDLGSEPIFVNAHVDENTQNTKMATVMLNQQIDDQTLAQYPIVGSSTCHIFYIFGAVSNEAKSLARKAAIAQQNQNRKRLV